MLEEKNLTLSRKLVDYIVDEVDVEDIESEMREQLEKFKNIDKKDYNFLLRYVNTLFLNVLLNELSYRCSEAEKRAIESRRVINSFINELREIW